MIACFAAVPMLAHAACSGDDSTSATGGSVASSSSASVSSAATGTGGAGGSTSASSGGAGGAGGGTSASSGGGGGQGGADCVQEVCDGLDNDCDGTIDDGFGSETCGIGACETTVSVCQNGQPVPCVPLSPAPSEACEGTDDDCDGAVDEGCICLDGQTQSCYTGSPQTQGIGECHDGSQTCDAVVGWSACTGDATPSPEACDGKDNDCDGATDNGDPGGGVACMTGLPGVCASGTTACQGAVVVCVQDTQPSTDVCDGLDNDCNTATADGEQDPGTGSPCDGADVDLCDEGSIACIAGALACTDPDDANPELCNGVDDDCDTATADGSADPGVGAACDGPDSGACTDGIQQCSGGTLVCNDPDDPEQCNAVDDDCDGIINDGIPPCGTCAMPHPVPAGGISGTYQMSGSSTTSGSCGGNGLDRYHIFVPSGSGTASISLVTDYWPSVVYVRQGSCGGSQVVCDYEPGPWPTNVLSFPVTAGTTYYIIVDHGTYNGTITLTYTMTLTPP
jgi:hypothetical protein